MRASGLEMGIYRPADRDRCHWRGPCEGPPEPRVQLSLSQAVAVLRAGRLDPVPRQGRLRPSLLLRQFGSRMFGALKTNFILLQGETENVIGEFNRKINILNRYALDLKADPTQSLDRRVAVAIGVILDMDEKPWVT